MTDFLERLREANILRDEEWDPNDKISILFRSTEFGEEAGEVLGAVKKLEREKMNLVGSRSSTDALAEEMADVLITLDLLAMEFDIDLASATVAKFNKTSEKNGLSIKLRGLDD